MQKLSKLNLLLLSMACSVSACKKEDKKEDPKDNKAKTGGETAAKAATTPQKTPPPPAKKELPPPPKEVYEGKSRVVNLLLKDGKPVAVDVWATRSFKHAAVKLAENVKFGEASDWFQSPKGSPVKIFPAGSAADSKENFGGLYHPKKGEHLTGIVMMGSSGSASTASIWETAEDPANSSTPDAPEKGKAYVVLRAGQLRAHEATLKETVGDWAVRVGMGGKCAPQRAETLGFSPAILGGTQPVELDLAPGKHTITIHKRDDRECTDAGIVHKVEIEVAADSANFVALYTEDGKTLKNSIFPMVPNGAKPYGTNKANKEKKDAERAAKKAAKEAAAKK